MPKTTDTDLANKPTPSLGASLTFTVVDGVWTWEWNVPDGVILAPRQIVQLRRTFELALKLRRMDSVTLKEPDRVR